MPGFFSSVDHQWQGYDYLREKYANAIPIPHSNYFHPFRSIDDVATCAIRPIEKPLWLALHTLGFLIKGILDLLVSLVLAPCALILTLVAPNSNLKNQTGTAFKLAAASTVVDAGMTLVALVSTVLALVFNPLHVITRATATVFDGLKSVTESCGL